MQHETDDSEKQTRIAQNVKLMSNLIYFIQGRMKILPQVWEVFGVHKHMMFHQDENFTYPLFNLLKPKAFKRFIYSIEQYSQHAQDTITQVDWEILTKEH